MLHILDISETNGMCSFTFTDSSFGHNQLLTFLLICLLCLTWSNANFLILIVLLIVVFLKILPISDLCYDAVGHWRCYSHIRKLDMLGYGNVYPVFLSCERRIMQLDDSDMSTYITAMYGCLQVAL